MALASPSDVIAGSKSIVEFAVLYHRNDCLVGAGVPPIFPMAPLRAQHTARGLLKRRERIYRFRPTGFDFILTGPGFFDRKFTI